MVAAVDQYDLGIGRPQRMGRREAGKAAADNDDALPPIGRGGCRRRRFAGTWLHNLQGGRPVKQGLAHAVTGASGCLRFRAGVRIRLLRLDRLAAPSWFDHEIVLARDAFPASGRRGASRRASRSEHRRGSIACWTS